MSENLHEYIESHATDLYIQNQMGPGLLFWQYELFVYEEHFHISEGNAPSTLVVTGKPPNRAAETGAKWVLDVGSDLGGQHKIKIFLNRGAISQVYASCTSDLRVRTQYND